MIDQARARIEGWTTSLLEGWGTDPLLDAKDSQHCLALPGADPILVAKALAAGGAFAFEVGLDAAANPGWLHVPLTSPQLDRRLTLMRRTARRVAADRAEHVLWLALGTLVWQTTDGTERQSPLALWPVELERSTSGMRLVPSEALTPRINPALVGALEREMTVVLALPQSPLEGDAAAVGLTGIAADAFDLETLLGAAEGLAVVRPGWRVERVAKLAVLSLARHILASDLAQRAEEIAAHPLVGHLASIHGPDARRAPFAQPTSAAAQAVTRPLPSYDVLAPLDADASQLAAIHAAGLGASFVVQAPPGTGATQTIANLLVHAAAAGKRVLVVSDKASALEAVQGRLAAVGLGEMCLPLYGVHTDRAKTLRRLARVVERTFRPGSGPASAGVVDTRLAELRAALDAHVAALHAVGPFGRSMHEVLGRLVDLRTSPHAELAERDATGLDRKSFDARLAAVITLAEAALPIEPIMTHPWRMSTLEAPAIIGCEAGLKAHALAALDVAGAAAMQLAASVREMSIGVSGLVANTRDQLSALGALALVAAGSPRPGAELLTNLRSARNEDLDERVALIRARGTGTVEVPHDPLAFLALAHKHHLLSTEVAEHFTDAVEDIDAPALWAQLRKWTNSMGPLRYVALRAARTAVKTSAIPAQLETDTAMIAALEAVIAERACRTALCAAAAPARRWFGDLGGDPLALDLTRLDEAVAWAAELRRAFDAVEVLGGDAGRSTTWRALVAQVAANPAASTSTDPDEVVARIVETANEMNVFARLAEAVARWSPALAALADATGIPAAALATGQDHLASLIERIEGLRDAVETLPAWVTFHMARRTALTLGVDPAIGMIERGDLGAAELAPAWERATLLAWADAEISETPALSQFHGASHHAQVAAFAELDRGSLALARARAVVKLAEMAPRAAHDASGEVALLLAEIKDARRSLRAVLAAMPTTLGKIVPCILATPHALAETLDPALRFDLVIVDEAARLTTAATVGALARGDSAMIVGDSARCTTQAHALLDDCATARLPELALAWHYRSKHEDLVAYANERAYGDRLEVLPVAHPTNELGISLRSTSGSVDGDTLANRTEAEAVVADIVQRLRDPNQRTRSIGVIALTSEQRELIEDLLDAARASEPALDGALEPAADATFEPLLVTDLASATGDERDVVLMSVGYDATSVHHGPLTELGGERLLAAAIACAREQLVLFTSVSPEELSTTGAAGISELAALLIYARLGGGSVRRTDEVPPASPITLAIARALTERGWTVRHQVGVGPFKLDLAVVDPNDPERFVLAIEHDGASYARSPHARDRDRLRPAVLAQLGWKLHRFWGLDWWLDAEREVQRAHAAIVTAIAANRQRPRASAATKPPRMMRSTSPGVTADTTANTTRTQVLTGDAPSRPHRAVIAAGSAPVARVSPRTATSDAVLAAGSGPTAATPLAAYDGPTTPVRIGRNSIAIGPYTAAAIPAGRRTPDDLFAPRYLGEVGKIVEQVLAAEAPMHVDLLARRVGGYFGIGRLTQRVTDQVRVALEGRGKFGDENTIVWRLDQDPASVPPVRVSGANAAAKRAIEEVPLAELASAARIVVERASGITTSELVRDSARLLGFARLTEQVTERMTLGVRLAIARELVRVSDANKVLLPD